MKNNQYTPLPLSKIISERLPELETEMIRDSRGVIAIRGGANWDMNLCSPTYSFTDCLWAIEMLGEKEGWKPSTGSEVETRRLHTDGSVTTEYRMAISEVQHYQHRLLDKYLADHHTIGKNTIAYLTELFTEKQEYESNKKMPSPRHKREKLWM